MGHKEAGALIGPGIQRNKRGKHFIAKGIACAETQKPEGTWHPQVATSGSWLENRCEVWLGTQLVMYAMAT